MRASTLASPMTCNGWFLNFDLGKRDGLVFDGEALQEPHAYPEQEPALLRALQTEQEFIEQRVANLLGHAPEEAFDQSPPTNMD